MGSYKQALENDMIFVKNMRKKAIEPKREGNRKFHTSTGKTLICFPPEKVNWTNFRVFVEIKFDFPTTYTRAKTHKLLRVDENNVIEHCFAAYIV